MHAAWQARPPRARRRASGRQGARHEATRAWRTASLSCRRSRRSEVAAAFEGAAHGDLVGELELAAVGDAAGDAAGADGEGFEDLGEVEGGGFAFDAEGGGDDDFADAFFADARDERFGGELLGADAVERGEERVQDVVAAAVAAGAL